MLSGDLDGEADWDLADLPGDPGFGCQASNFGDYGRLQETCVVVW